jgi:tetratricopeptide (TPR) repeat protein
VERGRTVARRALARLPPGHAPALVDAWILAEAELFAEAFELAARLGGDEVATWIRIGEVASARGHADVAAEAWDGAWSAARRIEGRDRGWRLRDLAVALAPVGDRRRFAAVVAEAVQVAAHERSMTVQLAPLMAQAGEIARATAALRRMKDPGELVPTLLAIARAEDARSVATAANAHRAVEQALQLARGAPRPALSVRLLQGVAETCRAIGNLAGARATWLEAVERARELVFDEQLADATALLMLARALRRTGEIDVDHLAGGCVARASEQLEAMAHGLVQMPPERWQASVERVVTTGGFLAGTCQRIGERAAVGMHLARALSYLTDPRLAATTVDHLCFGVCWDLDGWR